MTAEARPEPPADLRDRTLPVRVVPAGDVLHRIHRAESDAIHFGPQGPAPVSRFDDPEGEYTVCYLGEEPEAAFVETLLRRPGRRLISWRDIEARRIAEIDIREDLRLVELFGPALGQLGATAEVASTRDYTLPRAWSRALREHAYEADGLLYRCRHDDSVRAVALYDRSKGKIALLESTALASDMQWLGRLSERYRFGLSF